MSLGNNKLKKQSIICAICGSYNTDF